ncbi:MAG: hypothetical protein LBV21_07180, partial [Candidatus Adiutrix sp.]|nr:hypothetical protein [Candidatus Adiutrix sp.]
MKSKTPFIILGLVVLAAAAFALSRPTAGDPYETFTLALDRLAGPGQWSAQSHASGGDGLTVTGLSVTLPPATDGGRPEALTIESVLIKNGPSKSWLEKILAAGNWQNQPAAALAENVKLAGLRLQAGRAEGECEVRVEELTGAGVNLAAAAQGAPAGPAGFLKALRIGSLGYKNLQFTLKAGEAEAVSTVVALTAEELAFDGETAPELAVFDPSGLLTALGGLSAKSLKAEGLGLNFIGRAEESKVTSNLSIASVEHKDFRALKSIGSLRLNNLKGSLTGPQDHVVTWALADLSLTGLDAGAYMAQLLPGLAALKTNPDDTDAAEKLLAGSQNLAGFFVSPISLDDATLAGLEFSLGDLASIKLAESRATGPYRAG